jgi:hypothetical protein
MKSFLLKDKKPICKWGMIPDNVFFEGEVPEGYGLAISPHSPYIIVDIDRHGNIDGYNNIPSIYLNELFNIHFNYSTKGGGYHIWIKYSGAQDLRNKPSGLGIDLRTHKGYVKFYPSQDIRTYLHLIKESSENLNKWLEQLFL